MTAVLMAPAGHLSESAFTAGWLALTWTAAVWTLRRLGLGLEAFDAAELGRRRPPTRLRIMPDEDTGPAFPPDGRVPILGGKVTYLRPGERSDVPLFVRWFSDLRTTRTAAFGAPTSLASEEAWFDQVSEHHGKDRWFFLICLLENDRPIGTTDLREVDLRSGSASLGIAIGDPDDTGRGYGSDALRILLGFGFDRLRLERIGLEVFDFNDPARRLYERAGFRHEGTRRHALFSDGAFHDIHQMSILRDEWLGRRPR